MIIKSMSRKGGKDHFAQLIGYICRKAAEDFEIYHNLRSHAFSERGRIIDEFRAHAQNLNKFDSPKLNKCYHEIVSLRYSQILAERQKEAIHDLVIKYLQSRCPHQLAYGRLHIEKEHLHVHLCISSNALGYENNRRVRLAKKDFLRIQRDIETYLHQEYPELEQEKIYTRENYGREKDINRTHTSDAEHHMKKRAKVSRKEQLRRDLEAIFAHSRSKRELEEALREFGIFLTNRGKNFTASRDSLKCRLSTLELSQDYEQCLARFERLPEQTQERKEREEKTSDRKSEHNQTRKSQREMTEAERRMEELRAIRESFERAREFESEHEPDQM